MDASSARESGSCRCRTSVFVQMNGKFFWMCRRSIKTPRFLSLQAARGHRGRPGSTGRYLRITPISTRLMALGGAMPSVSMRMILLFPYPTARVSRTMSRSLTQSKSKYSAFQSGLLIPIARPPVSRLQQHAEHRRRRRIFESTPVKCTRGELARATGTAFPVPSRRRRGQDQLLARLRILSMRASLSLPASSSQTAQ